MTGTIPGKRDGHSACVIHDKMYIFGGYEEDEDKFSNEVHCLDFTTFQWTLLKVLVITIQDYNRNIVRLLGFSKNLTLRAKLKP